MRVLLLLCLLILKPVTAEEPARLLFSRVGPTRIGLFLADATNSNERALLPACKTESPSPFDNSRTIVEASV